MSREVAYLVGAKTVGLSKAKCAAMRFAKRGGNNESTKNERIMNSQTAGIIAIILVNWNNKADTIECLESLLRLDSDEFIAIVVDNGSTDGSITAINHWARSAPPTWPADGAWRNLPCERRREPIVLEIAPDSALDAAGPGSIVVIPAGANLGFAGANNIGLKLVKSDPRVSYILLLNNDTIVKPDVLGHLRATATSKPRAAFIGASLMYYHSPETVQGVAAYFCPWKAGGGHLGFNLRYDQLPPIEELEARMNSVMGAAMFLPVSTLNEVGLMSESYFLYFEELDWAHRLSDRSRQTVCLEALVYHKEGGTIGTSSLRRPSDTSIYYLNRNLIRFMWRWHRWFIPVAILRIFREAVRYRGHRTVFPIMWAALRDGLLRSNLQR